MTRDENMLTNSVVRLSVSWGSGDEVGVDLLVSKRNWSKIIRGGTITIRGSGYRYDGEFYWDYWDFSGGIDGELRARYGSPKDGDYGDGFVGTLRDALVE
jgi:hypothetical protein